MFDFLLQIAAGLAVLAISGGLTWWISYRRGSMSGLWYGAIVDDSGNVVKTDTFTLRQWGDSVSGSIARTFPKEQTSRNWVCHGRFQDHNYFSIYWPKSKLNRSSGCWFLHQIDDETLQGYYFRIEERLDHDPSHIRAVRMYLSRQPLDASKIYPTRGPVGMAAPSRPVFSPEAVTTPPP